MGDSTWESESDAIALGAESLITGFNAAHPIYGQSSLCCNNGTVKLPAIIKPPDLLAALLTQSTPHAVEFRKHLRQYNNSLAMASMSCKHYVFNGGVPALRIGGEVKHYIGSPAPAPGSKPQFLSTYVYDPSHEAQLQHRLDQISNYMRGTSGHCAHNLELYWCSDCGGAGPNIGGQPSGPGGQPSGPGTKKTRGGGCRSR